MGVDLHRGDDVFSVSVYTWQRAYALAIEGGWEPRGTLPPKGLSKKERTEWQGTYDSNDGQFIAAVDAANMAAALEKMVTILPPPAAADPAPFDVVSLSGARVDPRTYFTVEDMRKILKLLIEFLRGGACAIW
jgi:hypothetical protein